MEYPKDLRFRPPGYVWPDIDQLMPSDGITEIINHIVALEERIEELGGKRTDKLTAHFTRMQAMASRYLEPVPYTDHEGETWSASSAGRGFIKDMIYMLDGPEQREAQK